MPKVKCNDINISYEEFGQGEPLVLISGFTADKAAWLFVVELFAQTHRVIIFDNRGIGQSDQPDCPYTIEMMMNDTLSLCDALAINQASFIGSSMGGSITQAIAYHHPERVKKIVLSNTFNKIAAHYVLNTMGWLDLLKYKVPMEDLFRIRSAMSYSAGFISSAKFPVIFNAAINNQYPLTEVGARNQFNALTQFDSTPWLDKIKTPCLVIGSDEDIICLPNDIAELARQIPHSQFIQFKKCGHVPMVEQPDKFHQIVTNFLKAI